MWGMLPIYMPGAFGAERLLESAGVMIEAGARPWDGLPGAAWWGGERVVREMLARGAPAEDRREIHSPLLMAACASRYNDPDNAAGWIGIVEALLEAGADPSHADRWGLTAWGFAHDVVREVLERRGVPAVAHHPGLEPYLEAVRAKAAPAIRERVRADPELLRFYDRETGCTAILHLLLEEDEELATELLEIRGEPDDLEAAALGRIDVLEGHLDRTGIVGPRMGSLPAGPALHLATWFGQVETVRMLLERGFSVAGSNGPDIAGDHLGPEAIRDTTPLHVAAARGQVEIMELFLDRFDAHWSG